MLTCLFFKVNVFDAMQLFVLIELISEKIFWLNEPKQI